MPEHDPENHQIMRLRVDERLAWADIAQVLNEERISKGKVRLFHFGSLSLH